MRRLLVDATGTIALAVLTWAAEIPVVPVAGQVVTASGAALAATVPPARTLWGDPELLGSFTNNDEHGIPLERAEAFESRRLEDVSPVLIRDRVRALKDEGMAIEQVQASRLTLDLDRGYETSAGASSRPISSSKP